MNEMNELLIPHQLTCSREEWEKKMREWEQKQEKKWRKKVGVKRVKEWERNQW